MDVQRHAGRRQRQRDDLLAGAQGQGQRTRPVRLDALADARAARGTLGRRLRSAAALESAFRQTINPLPRLTA
jgi:hypothetical protein